MSSPDIELLSTKRISAPHLGHFVREIFDAGVRKYFTVIHEGNFISGSLWTVRQGSLHLLNVSLSTLSPGTRVKCTRVILIGLALTLTPLTLAPELR